MSKYLYEKHIYIMIKNHIKKHKEYTKTHIYIKFSSLRHR